MNKLLVALLSSAALLVGAAAASAADLPARNVYKAPIAAPAFSWTGIYIGGNVGYGWGRTRGTAATTPTIGGLPGPGQFDLDGIVGGGQIGANYQIANWVLGIEADYQGSSVDGSGTLGAVTDSAKVERFGTVRGRLGYAWDRWMVYGTGGYAFSARTNYTFVNSGPWFGQPRSGRLGGRRRHRIRLRTELERQGRVSAPQPRHQNVHRSALRGRGLLGRRQRRHRACRPELPLQRPRLALSQA